MSEFGKRLSFIGKTLVVRFVFDVVSVLWENKDNAERLNDCMIRGTSICVMCAFRINIG